MMVQMFKLEEEVKNPWRIQGRKEKGDALHPIQIHLHLILKHHLQNQILIQVHLVMEGIRKGGGQQKEVSTMGENRRMDEGRGREGEVINDQGGNLNGQVYI